MRWPLRSAAKNKKLDAYALGLRAESVAALYLMCRGCKILARRFKTPLGEIDLIAKKGKTILFIEVKARMDKAQALESVRPAAQERIIRAAQYFLARHPQYQDYALRFDVAAFCPPFRLHYLDNAWASHT